MKRLITLTIVAVGLSISGVAMAAEQTVKLAVANMYCDACPLTVQKSLSAVSGVSKVAVSFKDKTAIVTFDDGKTNVAVLTAATTNAGYPSNVAAAPTDTKTQ